MPSFPDRPAAFPGWVGLATQPKIPDADRSDPLAPRLPEPWRLAVPGDWTGVRQATPFLALGRTGSYAVTFRKGAEVPYGCDGTPTAFGLFDAAKRLGVGPYLVVPAVAPRPVMLALQRLPLAEVPPVRMPMALVRPEALAGWRAGE
ncbi:MAG: hypothetical protein H7338_12380 [Candidatus Sericytochromatia bacterium]|nr:hypothetical protein [Candidatus Sericytochromatia bacterium]